MFLQHYGFHEDPFGTPDARYVYLSPTHRQALASLYHGLLAGRSLSALVAGAGAGKTMLLFHLLRRLQASARAVFVFQARRERQDLLGSILSDLGALGEGDVAGVQDRLRQILAAEARRGRRCIVILDEAHHLSPAALEAAYALSEFEAPGALRLQVILSGQPWLADQLASPPLARLRRRISVFARIEPLTAHETARYIEHKMRAAGADGLSLFTSGAIGLIAEATGGVPREIDTVCCNALWLGCALRRRRIDRDLIQNVVADLQFALPNIGAYAYEGARWPGSLGFFRSETGLLPAQSLVESERRTHLQRLAVAWR
jgi:general secretion pathway protein A